MVELMRSRPEVGAAGCKLLTPAGQVQELGLQYINSPWTESLYQIFYSTLARKWLGRLMPQADPNVSADVIKLYGGCLMVRKTILDRLGWFDERYFMYAEDVDLCRSVLAAGWKLHYLISAEVIHVGAGTSDKAPSGFAILMKCESIEKFLRKYYGSLGSLFFRTSLLVGSGLRLLLLTLLFLPMLLLGAGIRSVLKAAWAKHRLTLLWSLGLRKAKIAK
jgi:GT2 family glycosyltransferase